MFSLSKALLTISIIVISVCSLNGCIFKQSDEKFKVAWQKNDSAYVKDFIKLLENETPEEVGAIAEITLSEHTNFGYGLMYYPRKEGIVNFWDTIPELQQEIIKQNIISVWLTYVESDLFLKKECIGMIDESGDIKSFHEKFYPKRTNIFSKLELHQIKLEMNKVASSCN